MDASPSFPYHETVDGRKSSDVTNRIVVAVDDDSRVRESIARLASSAGLEVEVYPSAEEMLLSGVLARAGCMITDIRMPGMDGLGLQQHLADTGRQIPIIFLSARASEKEKNRALREGAVSFLHKPVGKDVLLLAICASLECTESGLGSDT